MQDPALREFAATAALVLGDVRRRQEMIRREEEALRGDLERMEALVQSLGAPPPGGLLLDGLRDSGVEVRLPLRVVGQGDAPPAVVG